MRREFLAWHATVPPGRPFFAFLNLFDAHRPRYAPPEYDTRFSKTPKGVDRYDNAIAYMDHELGLLIDALRARGALDHTVVVVVGDHGELLGEHGLYGHSTSVYRDVLWVPFVVRYPARISAGARVASPVSLRDLAATIVDLTGASGPSPGFPGTSLASLPAQPDGRRSAVFSYGHQGVNVDPAFPNAAGAVYSLVTDSLHYVRHPGNAEFLFSLADSAETLNLLRSPLHAVALEAARRTVADLTHNPSKP